MPGGDTKIKWPNDLYWQDRKAGGILIENVIGVNKTKDKQSRSEAGENEATYSAWHWSVIGVGINICQTFFPEELKNPVSLRQITGSDYRPVELAKELRQIILKNFHHLVTKGFDDLYSSYLAFLYKKGEAIKLKKGSRVFEATIKSVSPTGKLIVQHAIEEVYDFGEIEWLIPTVIQEK